ncbi:hypothetical protein [Streptomyces cyaneofuscatus]|uniref:hypothetical protein n=1 Tax=Streptomyces cyaneofuscatus TaxID=66883 RepID=UPI00365BA32E
MERLRVLLVDAAPGVLLDRELERLLAHGLDVTLNLRRVADQAAARAGWGGRVDFTDFDPFDEAALLAETVRGGLGHDGVKSRAGVPLRAAYLAGATRAGLAHPLRVIGRAGAGTDHVDLAAAARCGVAVTHTPGSNAAFASPLLGMPNALLTPHTAGMTRTAMTTAALRCADHIAALLAGRPEGVPVATA